MTCNSGFNIIKYISNAVTDVYEAGEARAAARTVAEKVFNISMVQAYGGTARPLNPEEEIQLEKIVRQLRTGKPIQYIIGTESFFGREFQVTPDVLIPRPETAELIPIIKEAAIGWKNPVLLDAGTGSGCLAVTLKLEIPKSTVFGIDISDAALKVARRNAFLAGADITFLKADLLNAETLPCMKLDILASNPPYVMEREREAMDERVICFEPPSALFVPDNDPLLFYRALASWGQHVLYSRGMLLVEINSTLGEETAALFKQSGYHDVRIKTDSFGKNRFVVCRK